MVFPLSKLNAARLHVFQNGGRAKPCEGKKLITFGASSHQKLS